MADRRVQCPVQDCFFGEVPEANAFRILTDAGETFLLDFIHYTPATFTGRVVQRIRLHQDTLEMVRDRLSHDVVEIQSGISILDLPAGSMVN